MNFKNSVPFHFNDYSFIGEIINQIVEKAEFICYNDNMFFIKKRNFLQANEPNSKKSFKYC